MKISPFAYLLALGLHLSPTLAQSETSEDDAILSIPIKDVLAKNTAPYEQHQLFKTYTNWLSTSEEAKYVMENPNNPEIVTPSLVGIECYPDDAECYFSSEIDLSGVSDEDWQGLVETFEDAEDIPGKLKRQAATQRVFKFNVVTFFKGNDAKHKFRVNPKCRLMTYNSKKYQPVSTVNVVKNPFSRPKSASASVIVKNQKADLQINFRFEFQCKKGGSKCCINDFAAVLKDKQFSKKPDLNCDSGKKAGECKKKLNPGK